MVRSNNDEAGTVTHDDGTLEDSRDEEDQDSLSDNSEIPNNLALREQSKATIRMARMSGLLSGYPRVVNPSTVDQRSAGEVDLTLDNTNNKGAVVAHPSIPESKSQIRKRSHRRQRSHSRSRSCSPSFSPRLSQSYSSIRSRNGRRDDSRDRRHRRDDSRDCRDDSRDRRNDSRDRRRRRDDRRDCRDDSRDCRRDDSRDFRRREEDRGDGGGNRGYSPVCHREEDRGEGGGNRGHSPVCRRGQSPSLSPTPVKQILDPTIPSSSEKLKELEKSGVSIAN